MRKLLTALVFVVGCSGSRTVDSSALEASSAAMGRTIDFKRTDTETLVSAIEMMTNEVRAQHNLPPLKTHRALRRASQKYAEKMVADGFLAHDDPNTPKLRTAKQRVAAAGGENPVTAENIADVPAFRVESGEPFYVIDAQRYIISREPAGEAIEAHTYASYAGVVVEGWMNSPGHRRNLLADDALEQGIGAAQYVKNVVPAFVIVQKFQVHEPLR